MDYRKGKILAVWGSPNSGKTTFSIKLAKELAKEKTVLILFADNISPVIPTLSNYCNTKKSLGNLLSTPKLTEEEILKNIVSIDKNENIHTLGYKETENPFSYPKYSRERVVELINTLKTLVDYIIVDASSYFINDLVTITALEISDTVFRLNSCELKNLSYYNSCLPLLTTNKYKVENHINILSKFKSYDAKEQLEQLCNIKGIFPHMEEIREQNLCSELFLNLSSKEEQELNENLFEIISFIDDETLELKKKKKKGILQRLIKRGA